MNKLFKQVVGIKPRKNAFDLSHERKFSMNMGELVPILCEDVIPGDTFQINSEVMIRLAPMLAPIMHRVNVYTHFFFVPNRLVWDEWEDFITGGTDGDAEPIMPYVTFSAGSAALKNGSLGDYLGYSTSENLPQSVSLNALPFRAYQLIYNEYYRDQNLIDEIPVDKGSGTSLDGTPLVTLRYRAWEKDYFTSALPWTQRGGSVSLPLGGTAPVQTTNFDAMNMEEIQGGGVPGSGNVTLDASGNMADHVGAGIYPTNLEVDMTDVTASTIEDLRRATKLQQWLERNARGGARYIEQILVHFGVRSSDARLQRPEYLGGGKSPVVISEVLQQSGISTVGGEVINNTPQGEMTGHGISVGKSHSFKKFFEEHGQVIGIISVLPKTAYMQGTRKHLTKHDKFDFFFPEFAQLGEQPISSKELVNDYESPEFTFGYQSRFAEYKYIPSSVHGEMKDSLKYWHMARDFEAEPVLNGEFVTADPTTRIFSVLDEEVSKLYVQIYHNFKAIRPIPKFNNPSLL